MVVFSPRCRHRNVTWLNSHSCRCNDCNKVGHWFENEGIAMWVAAKKSEQAVASLPIDLPVMPSNAVTRIADNPPHTNAVA